MVDHGQTIWLRLTMVNHGRPWSSKSDYGRPWLTTFNHGRPWSIMVTCNLTIVIITVFDGRPWTIRVDHQILWWQWSTMVDHGHHFAWDLGDCCCLISLVIITVCHVLNTFSLLAFTWLLDKDWTTSCDLGDNCCVLEGSRPDAPMVDQEGDECDCWGAQEGVGLHQHGLHTWGVLRQHAQEPHLIHR